MPSWVTSACNSSEGIKVVGHGLGPLGRVNGPAICWAARSKLRVGPFVLGEGLAETVPRVEGTASGWFHRAANTSRSLQWKDYGPVAALAQYCPVGREFN